MEPGLGGKEAVELAIHNALKAPALIAVLGLALGSLRVCGQPASADPYEGLAKFKFGDSRLPLATIEEQIRKSSPAEYKAIETKLLAVLNAPETPKDAKRYICRWLAVVGSADCVPAVAPLLTDDDLSHPARMALEPMASPAAGAALRDALPKVHGRLLAGLIGSIGVRRDPEAVSVLARAAKDDDPVVANAAIMALGAIGTESAAQTLAGLQVAPALSRAQARARITAAGHLKNAGANPQAVAIYRDLMQPAQPQFIRIAALKGLIGALPQAEAVKLVTEMVQGEDAAMREATVAAYATSTDAALQSAVAAALPTMKSSGQLILLGVLADLPDVAARPAVLSLAEKESDPAVRAAAVDCLGRHGEAADVPMLVRLAGTGQGAVAEAAHKTLDRLGKPGVDEALIGLIESSDASDRATVLGVLASRHTVAALPTLVRLVGGTDAGLAAEAAKALGVMGQSAQLTALTATIVATENAQLRAACEEAGAGHLHSRAGQDGRGGHRARRARPGTAAARPGRLAAPAGVHRRPRAAGCGGQGDGRQRHRGPPGRLPRPGGLARRDGGAAFGGGGAPRAGLRRRNCGVARRLPAARRRWKKCPWPTACPLTAAFSRWRAARRKNGRPSPGWRRFPRSAHSTCSKGAARTPR